MREKITATDKLSVAVKDMHMIKAKNIRACDILGKNFFIFCFSLGKTIFYIREIHENIHPPQNKHDDIIKNIFVEYKSDDYLSEVNQYERCDYKNASPEIPVGAASYENAYCKDKQNDKLNGVEYCAKILHKDLRVVMKT
jgi:hypothetical protein